LTDSHKSLPVSTSGQAAEPLSVLLAHPMPTDPDLARVLDAWTTLPAPIKAAVLALIHTVSPP
jgi:hypothetical protein